MATRPAVPVDVVSSFFRSTRVRSSRPCWSTSKTAGGCSARMQSEFARSVGRRSRQLGRPGDRDVRRRHVRNGESASTFRARHKPAADGRHDRFAIETPFVRFNRDW